MSDERRVKKLNTKKKFVADGVFNAELNAFLTRVLGMEGYAGIEVRATSVSTEIRIKAAKHDELLDKGARRAVKQVCIEIERIVKVELQELKNITNLINTNGSY